MSTLKTDYKNDILDETVNEERTYDIVDGEGNILYSDVILRETTVLSQTGDTFGGNDINDTNKHLTDETNDVSFQFGIDQNGDYGYIKDGESSVTPFRTRHTETYKPTVRANNNDMGLYHTKRYVDTTAVPNANSTTYSATARGASLDMGATNTHRYVNTNGVPNNNTTSTTITTNGTTDLGATNTVRSVVVNVNKSPFQTQIYHYSGSGITYLSGVIQGLDASAYRAVMIQVAGDNMSGINRYLIEKGETCGTGGHSGDTYFGRTFTFESDGRISYGNCGNSYGYLGNIIPDYIWGLIY